MDILGFNSKLKEYNGLGTSQAHPGYVFALQVPPTSEESSNTWATMPNSFFTWTAAQIPLNLIIYVFELVETVKSLYNFFLYYPVPVIATVGDWFFFIICLLKKKRVVWFDKERKEGKKW